MFDVTAFVCSSSDLSGAALSRMQCVSFYYGSSNSRTGRGFQKVADPVNVLFQMQDLAKQCLYQILLVLRLDYFDRHTSTTKVEVGVENRFYVIEYLSIIRETQGLPWGAAPRGPL